MILTVHREITVHGVIVVSCRVVGVAEKPDKPKDPPKLVTGKITCTCTWSFYFDFELWCSTRLVDTMKEEQSRHNNRAKQLNTMQRHTTITANYAGFVRAQIFQI